MPLIEAALAVAACAIALMVAASTGGNDPTTPSPAATEQVFLKTKATDYEIIAARLAIASVPGVTIDQYLDLQGAATQLSCVFPDAPDLVHSIEPVDLPVSFGITADVDDANSTAHLRAIPNVRGVVTPETWNAWWTRIEEQLNNAQALGRHATLSLAFVQPRHACRTASRLAGSVAQSPQVLHRFCRGDFQRSGVRRPYARVLAFSALARDAGPMSSRRPRSRYV
jgi:hypothetical protein